MRNKETGEFELMVGNGQLLSGFFILVLLLAVTFAMGYVVGQNSPRSAKATAESAVPAATGAAAPDGRPQAAAPAQPAAPAPQPAATADSAAQPAAEDAGPQPTTQPARQPEPAAQAAAPPAAAASPCDARPGSCWQVGAWKDAKSAELLAETLKGRGYPASVKMGGDNLMHVMVGPYSDVETMGRVKTELETRFNLTNPIRK